MNPRMIIVVAALAIAVACNKTTSTGVQKVDVVKLVAGKSKVPNDKREAIPSTYYELMALVQNPSASPSASNATGALKASSVVVCIDANENAPGKKAQCNVQVPAGTFKLAIGESVTANADGEVRLTCAGDNPSDCKVYVVN
jgi:hypothetical protein